MRSSQILPAIVLFGALGGPALTLSAQVLKTAPPPRPETAQDATKPLSLQAKLVNIPVVVRDKKGALVQNLTKDDFALSIDGKPQTIRYFDKDSNLPLTLGLLVDVSQSQRSVLDQERTASGSFLENMLKSPAGQAPDRAFVIQFARETELLQDLTDSKPKLQAALKELDTPNPNGGGATSPDPSDTSDNSSNNSNNSSGYHRGGGTELYDALFLSAEDIMAKQTGRKAVVLLTDGVDNGSRKSLARAIESAQRANIIVYSIYFKGEEHHDSGGNRGGGFPGGGRHGGGGGYPGGGGGYPGGGGGGGGYPGGGGGRGGGGGNENRVDGKKVLQRISGETGGRMFEVKKQEDLANIYKEIGEELRSQYRLGYTPDDATAADGYHQIDLTIPKQNKLLVQTRDGYYTGGQ